MYKIKFELKTFPTPASFPKPILKVLFQNPNQKELTDGGVCIIDSGADYCTIPLSMQHILGLNLEESGAQKNNIECACGNDKFFGYLYKINLIVRDAQNIERCFLIKVNFVDSQTPFLLGRNFMDNFDEMIYDNSKKIGYFIKR